jgi:predicted Fe-Mo cluster-binding NifX family protein
MTDVVACANFGLPVAMYMAESIVGATMKTAITIWNNRVSPVFDVTGKALLYDSKGERICSEQQLLLPDACPARKVAFLVEAGTDVLICGAISKDAHSTATNAGIRVYPFIAGDVREIIRACLSGRLIEGGFAMPGCACRMACSETRKHGRGSERITSSTFFCIQEPDKSEV